MSDIAIESRIPPDQPDTVEFRWSCVCGDTGVWNETLDDVESFARLHRRMKHREEVVN